MSVSNAVGQNRVASTVGIQLAAGNFQTASPNLTPIIGIFGEANTANQSGLPTVPTQITSAAQAATLFGSGSPIHAVSRILFPLQGGGTNAPVWVYPQAVASGATARVQTITVTGPATAAGTHYVNIAGRENIDGIFYAVNITSAMTATQVATAIAAAINAVTASPVSATSSAAVVTVTTKWAGLSSETVGIFMDTLTAPAIGVTYVVAETIAGSATPLVTPMLNQLGSQWTNMIVNCYGTVTATMTEFEIFNGVPGLTGSTGRYLPTTFKPFVAITGSVADDPTSITSARNTQCTIAIAPAPQSPGMHYEAAANMALAWSNVAASTPNLGVLNLNYADMPVPATGFVPSMQDYNFRDNAVKNGCSTAVISNGVYKIKDFVTTYSDGTLTPQYRYPRDLNVDWNVEYGLRIIEENNVIGFTIANDNDTVNATNVIKPKQLKALLSDYADSLVLRGLLVDAAFFKNSLVVVINGSNSNRIDTTFNYKRSGIAGIMSTTMFAGFNFGTV